MTFWIFTNVFCLVDLLTQAQQFVADRSVQEISSEVNSVIVFRTRQFPAITQQHSSNGNSYYGNTLVFSLTKIAMIELLKRWLVFIVINNGRP